ncbi:MAG: diguanylate cyclase [Thermodesulfobacteriota bacterium]|nr:diguanylate cyclase [Thermodesulfobacteriota bacterium]
MGIDNIKYNSELILVVDDEEFVSEPIVGMLRHLGFKSESVNNGYDALKALKEKPYTFLLTDIKMPGMNGLELIQKTKNEYPQVSTVAMTGYYKEHSYVNVVNSGASDFINKPFGIEELEAKIRRAIIERNTQQELRRLSITDSLTGLYNQRHFYARLREEVIRAERQRHPLALIFLDLDDFKQYNDTRGHLEGDKLLQKVGRVINTNIRQGVDSGYRYGGDEFVIILIETDLEITQTIRKRIETSIREACKLGVSVGYAQFSHGLSPEEFMKEADDCLYTAKARKTKKKDKISI